MERLSTSYIFNRSLSGVMSARTDLINMYDTISSGKSINKASDDPVLAGRILDMQKNLSDIQQSERHSESALTDLSYEEAVLSQAKTLVLRARTLTLQGMNGTQGAANRQVIGNEINQILDQIGEIANGTNSEGAYLFAGYRADNPAYTFTRNAQDEITGYAYNGDNFTVYKTVSTSLNVATSHPGTEVFDDGVNSIFNALINIRDDLYAGATPTALDIAEVDAGYDMITTAITEIGSRTNQINGAAEVNSLLSFNLQKTLGKTRDLDLPTAITHFTQLETTVQAINNTFARVSQITLFDYI